jgi:hypothetical protein
MLSDYTPEDLAAANAAAAIMLYRNSFDPRAIEGIQQGIKFYQVIERVQERIARREI